MLYHEDVVQKFVDTYGPDFASVKQIKPSDNYKEAMARNLAVYVLKIGVEKSKLNTNWCAVFKNISCNTETLLNGKEAIISLS